MKSYDYAIKMELDGEAFYRELAEKIANPTLKEVIIRLADDEREHARLINLRGAYAGDKSKMPEMSPKENVFDYLKDYKYEPADDEHMELYRLAHKIETNSVINYKKMVEESETKAEQHFFEFIMKEELYHITVVEAMFK